MPDRRSIGRCLPRSRAVLAGASSHEARSLLESAAPAADGEVRARYWCLVARLRACGGHVASPTHGDAVRRARAGADGCSPALESLVRRWEAAVQARVGDLEPLERPRHGVASAAARAGAPAAAFRQAEAHARSRRLIRLQKDRATHAPPRVICAARRIPSAAAKKRMDHASRAALVNNRAAQHIAVSSHRGRAEFQPPRTPSTTLMACAICCLFLISSKMRLRLLRSAAQASANMSTRSALASSRAAPAGEARLFGAAVSWRQHDRAPVVRYRRHDYRTRADRTRSRGRRSDAVSRPLYWRDWRFDGVSKAREQSSARWPSAARPRRRARRCVSCCVERAARPVPRARRDFDLVGVSAGDGRGAESHCAGGERAVHRADRRRKWFGQGAGGARDSSGRMPARTRASARSTAPPCPKTSSTPSCSAMPKARSRARQSSGSGCSRVPTAAPCFSTRWGSCRRARRRKLLRVLQEGEVRRIGENFTRPFDARLVAATNRSLRAEVDAGRFRQDLLYRLDVIRIVVPPLRERIEDIPLLATRFWRQSAERIGSKAVLGQSALSALARYDWPGNVRELQNVLTALVVAAPSRGVVGAIGAAAGDCARGAAGGHTSRSRARGSSSRSGSCARRWRARRAIAARRRRRSGSAARASRN